CVSADLFGWCVGSRCVGSFGSFLAGPPLRLGLSLSLTCFCWRFYGCGIGALVGSICNRDGISLASAARSATGF
mgnify:CR=1